MAKRTSSRSTTAKTAARPAAVRKPQPVRSPGATTRQMAAAEPASDGPAPDHEQIATLAYQLFLAEGSRHGRDIDHWLQAEREIRQRALTSAA